MSQTHVWYGDMGTQFNDDEGPEVPQRAAGKIAAHLDVGTIVSAIVGFVLVFLLNRAIQNLDSLTAEVGKLNAQVAVILAKNEVQDRRDNAQDERLKELERLLAFLHQRK